MKGRHLSLIIFVPFALVLSCVSAQEHNSTADVPKNRVRRHLLFQNGTRILCRALLKDNILKVNQIFAHGAGFRANIDMLQPPIPHRFVDRDAHRIKRREIYTTMERLLTLHGMNGRTCIFKLLCDAAHNIPNDVGMFGKIMKLIFTHKADEHAEYEGMKLKNLSKKQCKLINRQCPLSQLELTPYTDV